MASDRETAALEKFLFQEGNTDNLKTAQLIHTLWPRISDRICGGFLENLATRIGQNIKKNIKGNTGEIPAELADDVVSGYRHGIGAFKSNLWITLKSWTEYDTGKSSSAVDSHRTCIQMENQSSGPNNWILGISSPMEKSRMKEGSGTKTVVSDWKTVYATICNFKSYDLERVVIGGQAGTTLNENIAIGADWFRP